MDLDVDPDAGNDDELTEDQLASLSSLCQGVFDRVVLDEAQKIKSPRTQTYQAVRLLNANHCCLLTAMVLVLEFFDHIIGHHAESKLSASHNKYTVQVDWIKYMFGISSIMAAIANRSTLDLLGQSTSQLDCKPERPWFKSQNSRWLSLQWPSTASQSIWARLARLLFSCFRGR